MSASFFAVIIIIVKFVKRHTASYRGASGGVNNQAAKKTTVKKICRLKPIPEITDTTDTNTLDHHRYRYR